MAYADPATVFRNDFTLDVYIQHLCEGTTITSVASIVDMDVVVGASNGYTQQFTLQNSGALAKADDSFCGSYTCALTMQDGSSLPAYVASALSIDASSTVNDVWNIALADALSA